MGKCDPDVQQNITSMVSNATCLSDGRAKTTLGESYEFKLHFTPFENHAQVLAKAVVEAFGLRSPVMKPENLCTSGALPCPLEANTAYTLHQNFPFSTSQPIFTPMNVTLDFSLVHGSMVILCVKIPLEIHPKPASSSLTFQSLPSLTLP